MPGLVDSAAHRAPAGVYAKARNAAKTFKSLKSEGKSMALPEGFEPSYQP